MLRISHHGGYTWQGQGWAKPGPMPSAHVGASHAIHRLIPSTVISVHRGATLLVLSGARVSPVASPWRPPFFQHTQSPARWFSWCLWAPVGQSQSSAFSSATLQSGKFWHCLKFYRPQWTQRSLSLSVFCLLWLRQPRFHQLLRGSVLCFRLTPGEFMVTLPWEDICCLHRILFAPTSVHSGNFVS